MQTKEERVSIFIDGSNLYHSLKKNNLKVSFEEIIKGIERKRTIKDIFYYTAELDKKLDFKKYSSHHKFLEKLRKIPNLKVILCNLKKINLTNGGFIYQIKGDDVNLASDLIKGSYENLYDLAIIVSGDEDFVPAIKIVRKNNKKIINAFFPQSSSYLLRTCCDGSINLKKILSKIRSPHTDTL